MTGKKHKILIVDDDESLRYTLTDIFEKQDYNVFAKKSGVEAVDCVRENEITVVLLDLKLEETDGITLLKNIKNISPFTECIMLTGYSSHKTAIEALNFGAYNYFEKPYDVQKLIFSVKQAELKYDTERRLIESEEKFRTYIENSPVSVLVVDEKGKYCDCNKAALELTGYSREELLNLSIPDVASPPTKEKTEQHFISIRGKGKLSSETNFLRKDGAIVPVLIEGVKLPNNLYLAFCTNITERKQAEEILLESENRFRTLFEQAAVGVALIETKTGRFIRINKKYCDFLGYTRDEMLNRNFHEVTFPEDVQKNIDNNALLLSGAIKEFSLEKRYVRKDGKIVWGNLTASPLWTIGKNPDMYYHIAVVEDITERKDAEKELRKSEMKYRSLFENMSNGFAYHKIITDKKGVPVDYIFLEVNKAFEKMIGLKSTEIINKPVSEVLPDIRKDPTDLIGKYGEVALRGKGTHFESYSDNLKCWYSIHAYSPRAGYFATVFEDITDRKKSENEKSFMLKSAKLVLENKPFEKTAKEIFKYCKILTGADAGFVALLSDNGEFNEILFMDSGKNICAVDKNLPMPVRGLRKKAYDKKTAIYENDFTKCRYHKYIPDGHVLLKNVLFAPLIIHGKAVGMIGLSNKRTDFDESDVSIVTAFGEYISIAFLNSKNINDLTESKKTAENYLNTVGVMMLALDNDGIVKMINRKGCEILGYSKKNIIGKKWTENFIPPKEKEVADRVFKHLIEDIDGNNKYVEGSVKCRYNNTKMIGWRNTIIKDKTGKIISTLSSGEDLTEMLKMSEEINKAQNELSTLSQHIEKVREKEKSNLSRAIHDELGQALTALKLDVGWMRNRITDTDKPVIEKLDSMSNLLEDTLDKVQKMAFDLRPDILDHLGLVAAIEWQAKEASRRKKIKLRINAPNRLLVLSDDVSTTLFRIFQEALTNIVRHSEATLISISVIKEEDSVIMNVKDNGIGMVEDKYKSSGSLGLIGMRERAKSVKGQIKIQSRPGKGTTITVIIPIPQEN